MTDTPEMVDRVAQAIAWTSLTEKGRATSKWPDDYGPYEREAIRGEAYAAITAMREPTEAMRLAGSMKVPAFKGTGAARYHVKVEVWQAMIDASLERKT